MNEEVGAPGEEEDLGLRLQRWLKESRDHTKDWRQRVRRNYDFYAGRQWTDDELAEMEEALKPAISFNRIMPMVCAVRGQQINNRQDIQFLPREQGDVQVNELLTGAMEWVDDECDAEDELSDMFDDLLIAGMGWSEIRISYDEDIDGKVHSGERFDPLESYWDRSCDRRNLKGAKWVGRGRWMRRKEVEMRWPKVKKVAAWDSTFNEPNEPAAPHDAARAPFYENDQSDWYAKEKDEVFIFQCQWYEHEPVYRVGEKAMEFSQKKYERLKEQFEAMDLRVVRQVKKRYKQAFAVGPFVVDQGDCPCPDDFTLRCVTGRRDASKRTWCGLVDSMIDPQKWSNKFFCDLQEIMVSNRQGGAFVEESALVDPRQAEDIWNDPNPLIMLQDGALGRGAVQERNPIPYPQGIDRMMEWAVNALPAVTGINPELFGSADRDQPNILETNRKRAALSVLADLFDSMRRFQKERGRVVLYFIQKYISDGRLIRITGQDGKEQYVPLALDPETVKYDVIVDESPTTPNQKEETFAVLMQLAPILAQMGIVPPVEALEYLPLPSSFVAKWKEQLQPDEPNPEQDQMRQMALRREQAEIAKDEASAEESRAKARKTETETQSQELQNTAVSAGVMGPDEL